MNHQELWIFSILGMPFLYVMLRIMNLRDIYVLRKKGVILIWASRIRMGMVLIEPSMERRQVICIVSRSREWACETEP